MNTRNKTIRVSDNRRFFVRGDGSPFFYLADTAWELFHRLNREDAALYLTDRADRGFTVIQASALAEYEFDKPDPYGHLPLYDNDPSRPNGAYFEHVDWIVRSANELGLTLGFLPTWGDKWNQCWGRGPEIFTPENARVYGEFLGRRYAEADIIWILGGDRPVETDAHRAIIRAMAAGLEAGDGGRHLMTFHPPGVHSSSEYWLDEPWLDFHMTQSGHSHNTPNYSPIEHDYALTPTKPCLDGEAAYEDHPESFKPENGYMDDYDVRKNAYWSVFAGACGHTYGCHDIWQFFDPAGSPPVTAARTPWREALLLPGANQMRHSRALIEERPFLTRVPDQELLTSEPGSGTDHIQAARDTEGSYALVYTASGKPFELDLSRMANGTLSARWHDPRTGESQEIGSFSARGTQTFNPPSQGHGQDWVLTLDLPAGE